MRILRIALASLLFVAGCSTTRSGEPTATGEPPATTGSTTDQPDEPGPSSTPADRNRPADIDIASLDPCALLNKVPVRKYGLDGREPVGGTSSLFPGNKDCFSGGIDNNLGLTFVAVADKDAVEFVETANAQVTEYDAEGYPLYVLENEQSKMTCFGVLDVHDGQFVWIAYGMGSPNQRPVTPKSKLCETVPMIAASTVAALG